MEDVLVGPELDRESGERTMWRKTDGIVATLACWAVALAWICIGPATCAAQENPAGPSNVVNIVTDGTWKVSSTAQANWNTEDFNDSSWQNAMTDYQSTPSTASQGESKCFGHPTTARWIWNVDGEAAEDCFVRKIVDIPAEPETAEMVVLGDNEVKVYINGVFVEQWDTNKCGFWAHASVLNIRPFLQKGPNIVALAARNYGGPCGVAAEMRINKPHLFGWPAAVDKKPALPEELMKKLGELGEKLSSDTWEERESATEELADVALKLGDKALPFIRELAKSGDPEVALRADRILKQVEQRMVNAPGDDAWDMTLDRFRALVGSAPGGRPWNVQRYVSTLAVLMTTDRKAVCDSLNASMNGDNAAVFAMVAQLVDLMGIEELLPAIVKYAENAPDGLGRVWAVSAIAEMGGQGELALLEKIAEGHKDEDGAYGFAMLRTALRGIGRIKLAGK
jgi:hypothetical protein